MGPWTAGWFAAALSLALVGPRLAADEVECPEGTERIHTDNPYEPFRCVAKGDRKGGLSPALGPKGFAARPRCPAGSRPVMTPAALQPYRCVMSSRTAAEPALTPEVDAGGRAKSWEVRPEPAQKGGVPGGRRSSPPRLTERSFTRYAISGDLSFDYPKDWHLTEAWTDEPPAIYMVYDTGGGKQVTMTLTAVEPGQAGYQNMDLAILMEKEWQNAEVDQKEARVAGLRARFATVPGASRSAYLDRGGGRYLTLNYSAPGELYEFYLPAFQRLLKSLRLNPR